MRFWKFKAEASKDAAELMVYGDIGEWLDVDSREFTQQLRAITASLINVRINSGGGSVFTAQAILSSLRRHPAEVRVYIDGLAASAASVIAMAGDTVVMPSNAMMMIHNPLTWVGGEAEDMRKMADTLDKVRDGIVAAYQQKTLLEESRIIELMDAETWMTASEAVELGFADEIEQGHRIAASLNDGNMVINGLTIDATRYGNMPSIVQHMDQAQQPSNSNTTGDSAGDQPEEPKEPKPMNLEQLKAEHPDLYAAVLAEGEEAGKTQERARIQAIEDMALKGHEDLIAQAKFENAISAEALAVQIIKAEREKSSNFLANRQADADEIGEAANAQANAGLEHSASEENSEEEQRVVAAAARSFSARNGHKSTK